MACAYPESVSNSPPVKICHYEKGNTCTILWHLEHFNTCANIDYGLSPLFKVNVRSPRSWSFEMCFKTEAVEERQFYGICLEPLIIIPDDIKITCRFYIVDNDGALYSAEPCFLRVTKLTGHVVFGHLIEKEFLSQNESRFLHHDTLLIRCELSVESSKVQRKGFPSAEDYKNFSSQDFVCSMMGHFYKERKYSNLTWAFMANMENVHKSILAARSQKFSEDLTLRIGLQPDVQTFDLDDDVGLALLLYIYTGNPYEIKCIPIGLNKEAEQYGLPLLAYFAEPYTMTFRSRIKVQKLNLALNIKNFYTETEQKRNSMLFNFELFEICSEWSLLLYFQGEEMNFRLSKLSCFVIPMTVELKTSVVDANNQYVLLNTQTFHSVSDSKETYSFATSATCLQNLRPDSNLKLKIAMKFSYHCIQDHGKSYEMKFSSELCRSEHKTPLDFERLKADIFNMYESEIFPDLILESENGQVFVHGVIAAYHSPFIASLLDSPQGVDIALRLDEPLQLQRVNMRNVAQWALVAISRFMYTGELGDITLEQAIAFLHAAKKYDLTRLRNEILKFLRRILNENTCRDIHSIASSFDEGELKAEAFQLICSELKTTPYLVDFWRENQERSGEADLSARPSIQNLESTRNLQAASRHKEPIMSRQFRMKDMKKPKSKLKRKKQIVEEKNREAQEKRSVEERKSEGKNENGAVGGKDRCVSSLPRSGKELLDEELCKRHDKTYKNMGKSTLPTKSKIKFRSKHETSVNFQGQDVKDIKSGSRRRRHMKKLNVRLKGRGTENIREIQLVIIGRNLDASPRISIGNQSSIESSAQKSQEVVANQPFCAGDTNTGLSPRQSEDRGRQESGDQERQNAQDRSPRYPGRIVGRVLEDIESRPLFSVDNATRVSDSHPSAEDQGSTNKSSLGTQHEDLAVPPIPSTDDTPPILSPERARFFKPEGPLVSHRPDARYQDLAVPPTPSTDDTISLLRDGRISITDEQGTIPDVVYQKLAIPPIPSTDDTIPMQSPRRITEDQIISPSDAVHQDLAVPPLSSADDIIPTLSNISTRISESQEVSQLDEVFQDQDVPPLPSTDDTLPMVSLEDTISFGRLGPMYTPRPGEIYRNFIIPSIPSMHDDTPMWSLEPTRNRIYLSPLFSPQLQAMYQGQAIPPRSTDDTMLSSERSPIVEDQQIPQPDYLHEDLDVSLTSDTDDIPTLSSERTSITEDQEVPRPDEVNQDLVVPPLPSTDDTSPTLSPRPTDISENQSPTLISDTDAVHQESSDTERSP